MSTDTPRPLTDHLEELRTRILWSIAVVGIFSCIAYPFVNPLLTWLAKPVGQFIFTSPAEAFFLQLKMAMTMGVIAAFPVILYHLWRFIEAALHVKERTLVLSMVPASVGLFALGIAVAFFVVVPAAMTFLLHFSSPVLRPMISLDAYLSFLFWMIIGFGTFFQLPLIVVALCHVGLVKPSTFAHYRRHVIVAIAVVAAFLTPGPDVFSQLVLAVPAYLLFEIALLVSRMVVKKDTRPPDEPGRDG